MSSSLSFLENMALLIKSLKCNENVSKIGAHISKYILIYLNIYLDNGAVITHIYIEAVSNITNYIINHINKHNKVKRTSKKQP